MTKNKFVSTPLFGSAIVAELPSNFADVRYVFVLSQPLAWTVRGWRRSFV